MKMQACKLGSCRSIVWIAVLSVFFAAVNESRVAAQDQSPSQLAAAIARTMKATRPSANPLLTQQFDSHENVVESRTTFKDANGFANTAAHRGSIERQLARYMCKDQRRIYIKKGVVFHDMFVGPDAINSFDFIIDEKACASLVNPVKADAATLTKMAQDIAQRLTTLLSTARQASGLQFKEATSREGVIRVIYVVTVPAFADYFKLRSFEIRGKTQGSLCQVFGDTIRQGVRVEVVYKLEDGPPIIEFPVDNSVC